MASMTVTLALDTKWLMAGIRVAKLIAYLPGGTRPAIAMAKWSAAHLLRYRIDGGRWRPMPLSLNISEQS